MSDGGVMVASGGQKAMKRVLVCGFAVVFLTALGCASGESYVQSGYDFGRIDKVAVVEVTGDVSGQVARNQIGDFFAMELLKKGYSAVERAQVQAVLEEQDFQRSELTTAEGAARAGRILNVPAAMIANITVQKESVSMTAKMVDVETASIVWIGSGYGRTGKTLATLGGAAVGGAAGTLLGGDSTGRVVGGVAGGVLGGAAGNALSPQTASQVQKVARKVCAELPARTG
jgi:hypothetical protein